VYQSCRAAAALDRVHFSLNNSSLIIAGKTYKQKEKLKNHHLLADFGRRSMSVVVFTLWAVRREKDRL
jgi:hypothetical protein